MTDKPIGSAVARLFGRGSVYTVVQGTQLVGGLILLPILTRLVSASEYGLVAVGLIASSVVAPLAGLGLSSAITREYFGAGGDALVRRLVTLTIATALVVTIAADITSPSWILLFGDVEYGTPLRLAVWMSWPTAVVSTSLALLRSEDRPWSHGAIALLNSAGAQLLGVVAVVWLETGAATAYLTGLLIGTSLAAILSLFLVRPRLRLPPRSDLRRAFGLGLPTVPHVLAMFLLSAGDRAIVERYLPLRDVGRYQVAYVVGNLSIVLLAALNHAWGPIIHGERRSEVRWRILAATREATASLVARVIVALGLLAPLALQIASPPQYDPVTLTPVVVLVVAAAPAYLAYLVHVRVLFEVRRAGWLAWVTPTVVVINLGLNIVLVPAWGLVGAAAATWISYLLLALLVGARARQFARLRQWSRKNLTELSISFLVLVLAAALPSTGPWLVIRSAAGFLVGAWTLVWLWGTVRQAQGTV